MSRVAAKLSFEYCGQYCSIHVILIRRLMLFAH